METSVNKYYKEKLEHLEKYVNKYNNINRNIAISKLIAFIISITVLVVWYFNDGLHASIIFAAPLIFILLIIYGQK